MNADLAIQIAIHRREITKAAQNLIGICAGVAADGHVNDQEIHFLRGWLRDNQDAASVWPGSAIAGRIEEILADGIVTQEERNDLLSALESLAGGGQQPAALPLDDDPSIYFRNMTYCFTGGFYFGTRANCERAVMKLEAMPVDRVSGKLDYLVIGSVAEPSWANASYGRKIETAIDRRRRYGNPCIISETQWVEAMKTAR